MDEIFDDTQREVASVTENGGNVRISPEVVSTIAGIAAEETEGVGSLYSSFSDAIAEKFTSKRGQTRGVKLEMSPKTVLVDLYIIIKYGYKIREVCERIQESVKNNIETMTGLSVIGVNVHVEGVSFEKKTEETESVIIEEDE